MNKESKYQAIGSTICAFPKYMRLVWKNDDKMWDMYIRKDEVDELLKTEKEECAVIAKNKFIIFDKDDLNKETYHSHNIACELIAKAIRSK